jgi:hypothetical protein
VKKAVLSNRIYINFEEELYKTLKQNLTYKIPSKIPGNPPETICLLKTIGDRFLTLPIGRTDLVPDDYIIVDKRINNPVEFPKFNYILRPSQQEIYDNISSNAIINADVSWGKTFMGIAIATKLQQKTLVIVHSINLMDQWVAEIKKTLKIRPGIVGGGKFTYKQPPITVATVQTLKNNINTLKDEFGFIILDEVHHCPAKSFSECVDTLKAKYKLGLTATLQRKDHLHVVIRDYFSNIVYRPPAENQMTPSVVIIRTDIPFSSNTRIPWANRVNQLCERPDYLDLVTSISERYADLGHIVLTVSDRVDFLTKCAKKSGDRSKN